MPGWRSSASSGPLTSMLSNATSTAWSSQRQRNGRQGENDEHSLMGHPGRARLPLLLGRGIQGVQVRPAREPHARALARRMARARRARDAGRRPAGRPRRRAVDADPDPLAAGALALETLALAGLYARYSLKLAATNPMVWAVVMGLLAAFVAYGRYALVPQV